MLRPVSECSGSLSSHPQVDPELAVALESLPPRHRASNYLDFEDLPGSRLRFAEAMADQRSGLVDGVTIADRVVPGPSGAPDVGVRIYRPALRKAALPAIYWMHGGGMVLGQPCIDDHLLSEWARALPCVVVSVDYRLAPEHPFPAPVEDCYAGLSWVAATAAELDVRPDQIAIGGSSAGGGLAAAAALLARDRKGPEIAFQLLIAPMLDDRNETASSHELADLGVWNRAMNIAAWEAHLGGRGRSGVVPPYAAAARATDVANLPDAYIDVGTLDLFRDECIEYGARLVRAGVSVELHVYPGGYHGFSGIAPYSELARLAGGLRLRALRRAVSTSPKPTVRG